jgi:hypothetical protein
MNQLSMFDIEEPPAAAAQKPPAPQSQPRPQYDPELDGVVLRRTREVIAQNMPVLSRLRDAAAGYFRQRSHSRVYRRNPAFKITIRTPEVDDEPSARMVIYPDASTSGRRSTRQVRVEPDRIYLLLVHVLCRTISGRECLQERLRIVLLPDGTTRLERFSRRTGHVDAEQLCSIAARFLEDPSAAVAASGTRCAFCQKLLTVPESRARGIGPECFGHYGDFLKYIAPVPDSEPTTPIVPAASRARGPQA